MIHLDSGDVQQFDVAQWAQEQSVYLSPPSLHHLLLYLCLNAFYKCENPEGKVPGTVLAGRSKIKHMQMGTGLGRMTILRALEGLQEEGYVIVRLNQNHGGNDILVAWMEHMDDVRAEYRAGVSDLPKAFRKPIRETSKMTSVKREDATILEFKKPDPHVSN